MKNISLILNIVLLIAVAYLFIDKFSASKGAAGKLETMAQQDAGHPLKIMTINLDSLHAKSVWWLVVEADPARPDLGYPLESSGYIV